MQKLLIISLLGLMAGVVGFFIYKNVATKNPVIQEASPGATGSQATTPPSPVFTYLSTWVPNATWGTPQPATEDTPYGTLTGMSAEGKVAGSNDTGNDNLRDQPFMASMGFVEDIKFAADGPGASNWGYAKTENGKMQVVIFRYSTQRLRGPENTDAPFVNLSAFVSDPFTKN